MAGNVGRSGALWPGSVGSVGTKWLGESQSGLAGNVGVAGYVTARLGMSTRLG